MGSEDADEGRTPGTLSSTRHLFRRKGRTRKSLLLGTFVVAAACEVCAKENFRKSAIAVRIIALKACPISVSATPKREARWRAWEIRSTFFAAMQEAGIPLDAAQRAGSSLEGCIGAPRRNASPASKEVISRQTPRTNATT